MKISRFQVKLIIIFLSLLLVPTAFFTYLIGRILTTSLEVLANERMERALGTGLEMAQRLEELEQKECEEFAEMVSTKLSAHSQLFDSVNRQQIEQYLDKKLSASPVNLIQIVNSHGEIWASAGRGSKSEINQKELMSRIHREKVPFSVRNREYIHSIKPIMKANGLIGAVVVSNNISSESNSVEDISDALRMYSKLGILHSDLQRTVWTITVAFVLFFTSLSVLIAFFLARSITKPILNLVKGAEEVAKGNLDYQVETKAKGEIGTLVKAFNSMITDLEENRRKLLQAERVAAWRDIARRIAHEIKNPLTPMQLSMFRLKRNLKTEDEKYAKLVSECSDTISNEIENLRNLADEFSKFAKMPEPKLEPSDLNELIRDTLSLYETLPNGISMDVKLALDLPQVNLDTGQIKQVLHNLIKNAIEAMPGGGNLQVITSLNEDMISVEISDTGCGMSEEVKSKLFTPYFTTKQKGTGLGMAVVQRIVEQHDGEIDVESQEGVGTRMRILLKS